MTENEKTAGNFIKWFITSVNGTSHVIRELNGLFSTLFAAKVLTHPGFALTLFKVFQRLRNETHFITQDNAGVNTVCCYAEAADKVDPAAAAYNKISYEDRTFAILTEGKFSFLTCTEEELAERINRLLRLQNHLRFSTNDAVPNELLELFGEIEQLRSFIDDIAGYANMVDAQTAVFPALLNYLEKTQAAELAEETATAVNQQ